MLSVDYNLITTDGKSHYKLMEEISNSSYESICLADVLYSHISPPDILSVSYSLNSYLAICIVA